MGTEQSQTIARLSQNTSPNLRITMALLEANSFRCANADKNYLKLFTERLSRENTERVLGSLKRLGERKRRNGDTALLDLGTILEEMLSKPNLYKSEDANGTRA